MKCCCFNARIFSLLLGLFCNSTIVVAAVHAGKDFSELLLLENGFTELGCKGTVIPMSIAQFGVCGPVSSAFSGVFRINGTKISVDIYNDTQCIGSIFEQRELSIGACSGGSYSYSLVRAVPANSCVVWGYMKEGCPSAMAFSGTVAGRGTKCIPALPDVDQSFVNVVRGGKMNVTVTQFDSNIKACSVLSRLDLLEVGHCIPVSGWYTPFIKLWCNN